MPEVRFTDIRRFASIDSTNAYLLAQARAGAPAGVVAVAEHQTAGRGRLDRRWEAPAGSNLLLSVLLRPDLAPERRHLAGAVAALAAADAALTTAGVSLGIKWPNDLQAPDGRKVAGVLAEADLIGPGGSRGDPLVVGIGINVNWPAADRELPAELVGVATSLRQLVGRPVDRAALLDAVLVALAPRVEALESSAGQAGQASEFAERCLTVGTRVRVELAGETFEGSATGLAPDGHLIVDVGGVSRTVVAGDVVHLRPGSGAAHPPGRQFHAD
jgi:BirA family biotin operon repressor/biotin-[acetyl-CoA-carboxylase] ligase